MLVDNKGKYWVPSKPYIFYFLGEKQTIGTKFETDGCSVPTIFMKLFTHTDFNKAFVPSAEHDYLCRNRIGTCKEVNDFFCKRLIDCGIGDKWYTKWKPYLMAWSCYIYLQYIEGWD